MSIIDIFIDMGKKRKPFKHFYSATGYANVDYTYTKASLKMYEYISSYSNHLKYMRLHNILTAHGRGDFYLFEYEEDYGRPPWDKDVKGHTEPISLDKDGEMEFDWTIIDKVYDILIKHNIKPIVETVYIPKCLQISKEENYIPRDYNMWRKIIKFFVEHCQERYGKEEVETWYFEVWNEPDVHQRFRDEPELFNALYDYMENAVHSVNSKIKVGGPAVMQGEEAVEIFKIFLAHCANGLNYVTGKFKTRIDFISVHCKGGYPGGYSPSSKTLFDSLRTFMDIVKEYPEYKNIEFFNDESDIVWCGNMGVREESWFNFRNTHYFPGFVCKMINKYCDIVEDEYEMNLSIVDSDNCHLQWEKYLFSGNRSQFTPLNKYPSTDLIRKPAYNSYVLLSRLGNQRLKVECNDKDFKEKFGILPTTKDKSLALMVWNFEDGIEDNVNHRNIRININNCKLKGEYKLLHYRIDKGHSNSYNMWEKIGKPKKPTIEEIDRIRENEGLELLENVSDIKLDKEMSFEIFMPMHSVSLLIIVPKNDVAPEASEFIKGYKEKGLNKNTQVFLKWKASDEIDFLYYKLWRKREDEKKYSLISDNKSLNTAVFTDLKIKKEYKYFYKVQVVNASMAESELSKEIKV